MQGQFAKALRCSVTRMRNAGGTLLAKEARAQEAAGDGRRPAAAAAAAANFVFFSPPVPLLESLQPFNASVCPSVSSVRHNWKAQNFEK
jgi:hypothetical protein